MGLWGMIAAGVGAVVGVVVAIYCPPAGAAITAACVAVVVAGANAVDAKLEKDAQEAKKDGQEEAKAKEDAAAKLDENAGARGASVDGESVDQEAVSADANTTTSTTPAAA